MKSLSVVVPTFNERKNIEILVPRIEAVFREHTIDGEIVVVDDHSTDGSIDILHRMAADRGNFRVIVRDPPACLARAWWEGFDAAEKEAIVCIDADLCHDPAYFPQMLSRLETCDVVIGSRYLDRNKATMEGKARSAVLASAVARHLTKLVTGLSETDTSHSFRMFSKQVFESFKDEPICEGNVFLIEFLMRAKREGYRVCEIPIVYGKRIHGETKLSVVREGIHYLRLMGAVLLHRIPGCAKF